MMFSRICLILVIGTYCCGSISIVECVDFGESSRSTRDAKAYDDGSGSGSANYNFQYAVSDGDSGTINDFGHEEERNGHNTKGQYRVLLPDGRLQVVTYTADENGYRADVKYENLGGGYSSAPVPAPQPQPSSSYGPTPPQPKPQSVAAAPTSQGYGIPSTNSNSGSSSFGRRNSGSFVKLRRNIGGQNHHYNYSF